MDNKEFKEQFKKRLYAFIIDLVKMVERLPKNDELCKVASNQIIRSVTSIGANYVEAQAASSRKDFANFLHHSLKSANESKFWLALLRDANKGDKDKINILLKELTEISNILASSLLTLKGKRKL
ncbi:MAG: four helix bundle protein [Candidatus Berkelbacteria bacterium]|nr:four helix bundle protein [Candidatus Berkelbacteria bacterium]